MEINDIPAPVPAVSKPVSIISIMLALVTFLAPILVLPVIAIVALPELSHAYKTPTSSFTEVVATIAISLCFAGFTTAFVSVAHSFKSRHEPFSPLPIRSLVVQSLCLVLAVIGTFFL